MKRIDIALFITCVLAPSVSLGAEDLAVHDINQMFESDIASAEQKAAQRVKENRFNALKQPSPAQAPTKEPNQVNEVSKNTETPNSEDVDSNKPSKPKNRFARPSTVTPEEFNRYRKKVKEILEQLDDPKALLEAEYNEGDLILSPNDIYTLRFVNQEIERAENSALVEPTVINNSYPIDVQNRYLTYDVYVHESGTTQIEFFDAVGKPWPIYYKSDAQNFKVVKQSMNTLWVTSNDRYKTNNMFVTLEQYPSTIQFNLIYSTDKRHGIATYTLPFISPVADSMGSPQAQGENIDLAGGDNNGSLTNSHQTVMPRKSATIDSQISYSSNLALRISDIPQEELSYLANTGDFQSNSEAKKKAASVMVNDKSIAQIWFYKDKFIVRTPYILNERYENVVNAGGAMKVYVANNLNSIIYFKGNQSDYELIIPDYHQYRKGWN